LMLQAQMIEKIAVQNTEQRNQSNYLNKDLSVTWQFCCRLRGGLRIYA